MIKISRRLGDLTPEQIQRALSRQIRFPGVQLTPQPTADAYVPEERPDYMTLGVAVVVGFGLGAAGMVALLKRRSA